MSQNTQQYSRFVDATKSYNEMKTLLVNRLGRELTEQEDRKIKWLADGEYDTIGVLLNLFDELSR